MTRLINIKSEKTIERTPSVTAFLNDIRMYKVLEESEILALIARAKEGDLIARNDIVNHNLRFIFSLCSKFAQGDEILSLVSLASVGMINAIDSFDATLGFKFLTYAVHYMRLEISEYFRTTYPMIKKSNSMKIGSKANKLAEKYYQEHMYMPSDEELIEMLEKEYNIVVKDKRDIQSITNISLSASVSSEDENMTAENCGEIARATASINGAEISAEEEDMKRKIALFLNTLSVRDANIIKMLFGIGEWEGCEMSEESVAERYGMSAERVRQLKNKSLKTMQSAVSKVNAMV